MRSLTSSSPLRLVPRATVVLALAGAATLTSVPASGASTAVDISVAGLDPQAVVIQGPQAATEYRFHLQLPAGASMEFLDGGADPESGGTVGEVLVVDAGGAVIGAFDQPWLQDAQGNSLPTSYRVETDTLIQEVDVSQVSAFPVVLDPIYSSARPPVTGPRLLRPTVGAVVMGLGDQLVRVPSNYVYNPRLGALHDYCTASPDEYPSLIGANADFRGPCARHDMCYGTPGSDRLSCDNNLYVAMMNNCAYYYKSWLDPNRTGCFNTAALYWAAVVVA